MTDSIESVDSDRVRVSGTVSLYTYPAWMAESFWIGAFYSDKCGRIRALGGQPERISKDIIESRDEEGNGSMARWA